MEKASGGWFALGKEKWENLMKVLPEHAVYVSRVVLKERSNST